MRAAAADLDPLLACVRFCTHVSVHAVLCLIRVQILARLRVLASLQLYV